MTDRSYAYEFLGFLRATSQTSLSFAYFPINITVCGYEAIEGSSGFDIRRANSSGI
jgi:hypothetical protein